MIIIMFSFDYDETISSRFNMDLSKDQWLEFITLSIKKIGKGTIGKILLDKLENFIQNGYNIQFTNKPMFNHIYPSIMYVSSNSVKICVPSVPYFIGVPIVKNCNIIDGTIKSLANHICISEPLNLFEYTDYITYEYMPKFIEIAHELIHTLRYFENYDNKEENIIYGLDDGVLKYVSDKINYITENMIRKEWNLPARLSHDSEELFVYNVPFTFENKDKFSAYSYFVEL